MTNFLKMSAVALALTSTFAAAQSGPEVTPYRPGAAASSAISAPGYFETEFSFDTLKGGGARADALAGILKYSVSESMGLIFGLPYLRASGGGFTERGVGDAVLAAKFVTKLNPENAFGFQVSTSLPTGKSGFRADDPTISLTGIYGLDFAGFHGDFNLGARRSTGSDSSTQFVWVAGLSRPIGNGLGWYVEGSGQRQSGLNTTTVLGALTYTVSKNLALDASISRARVSGENLNGFGVGMTYLFAK